MSASRRESLFARLNEVMPYGSSTCSKAACFLPEEPAVVERAQGCRVWDVDGREFIDSRNGLGPITLGYRHPAIDRAVTAQLEKGIIFSHPHRLEGEVAELLTEVIPCAEQARFLKTGGEANAACFRLARAHTGREHIVQVGYNGWLNSVAAGGQFRPGVPAAGIPAGVPRGLAEVHHNANWNDLASVEEWFDRFPGQVAAVAVSAAYADMAAGKDFYPGLRELCDRHGALLIFDEIVTGFRVALAGVQEYFGVTPDLAVFAKGMANGMPLSVYCGRRDVMRICGRGGKTVISSTYGGEALSLAAAKAAITLYRDGKVTDFLWRQGETMWSAATALCRKHGLPLAWRGLWPCPQIVAESDAPAGLIDDLFRAAYRNGLVLYNVGYVNFSHTDADIDEALARLDAAIREIGMK